MKNFILLSSMLALLAGIGACSSPQEKYKEAKTDAREDYNEDLKQAEEDYGKNSKKRAIELIENSEAVKINEEGNKIKVID